MNVTWKQIHLWQSDPDGLAIVADEVAVRVETPRQLLVTMQMHRPDQFALVDQAVCSQLAKHGPETYAMDLEAARKWAGQMKLNISGPTSAGAVEIGEQLLAAWDAHMALFRSSRARTALRLG